MEPFNKLLRNLTNFALAALKNLALLLISFYQGVLSPFLGGRCRYYPTCSHYAKECFEKHNVGRATTLAVTRILRCHPLGSEGFDPVPEAK